MRRFILVLVVLAVLAMSVGAASASGNTYVVRPGDTLASIAQAYDLTVWQLAQANGIWNPNYIYVGQVLTIPGGIIVYPPETPPYTPPPYTPPPYTPPPAYHGGYTIVAYYTVRYGDTLAGIARYYGTTWPAIAAANNLWNPNYIYAGQVLGIPRAPAVYTYTVRYGDTLASIARAYGTTWPAIASYNGLWNPNFIYAGMTLRVPVY